MPFLSWLTSEHWPRGGSTYWGAQNLWILWFLWAFQGKVKPAGQTQALNVRTSMFASVREALLSATAHVCSTVNDRSILQMVRLHTLVWPETSRPRHMLSSQPWKCTKTVLGDLLDPFERGSVHHVLPGLLYVGNQKLALWATQPGATQA